jgi:5-methylcytosine-specific restriction endonuclease McrA
MSFRCVKLNVAYEPLEIIPWWKAFGLVHVEEPAKSSVLWTYPEEHKIRSQYQTWEYPSIIVLTTHVKRRPEKTVSPSLRAILTRDLYTCQYCGNKLSNSTGTRDHIMPKSLGGPNSWSNLVACCWPCQEKKADRHPDECGMRPKRVPATPRLSERFQNAIKIASSFERNSWKSGFKNLGMDYLIGG